MEVVACYRWHAPRATVQGPRIARPDGRSLPPPRGERRCGGRAVVPPPPWAGVRRLSRGRRRRCGAAAGLWANVGAAWRASACVGSGWRAGVVCGAGGPRCCRVRGCGCRCRLLRQVDVRGVASSRRRRRRRCLGTARLVVPGEAVGCRRRLALARAANGRISRRSCRWSTMSIRHFIAFATWKLQGVNQRSWCLGAGGSRWSAARGLALWCLSFGEDTKSPASGRVPSRLRSPRFKGLGLGTVLPQGC